MIMGKPDFVTIFEAGPRDGLQSIKDVVPTDVKVELINRLADAGIRKIEGGSFVSPKWVPQMADTPDVLAQIDRKPGVTYPVLTPNMRGYEGAKANGCDEVGVFTAASESFNKRNINMSIAESLEKIQPVCDAAKADGVAVRGYVSTVLGCPFEGVDVDPVKVAEISAELMAMGCYEVSLGDTIGTGTPERARRVIEETAKLVPLDKIAIHFHDTYGQALANLLACIEMGVAVVDSSCGGLGGCPYAPGATGNVATEEVVYMLHGMGIDTGIDLDKLVDAAAFINNHLGRKPASRAANAILAKRDRAA